MLFFDLHCHPGTKTLFKHDPNQISPWENLNVPDGLLGNAFDSQSSYRMIADKDSDINLLCIALHPPETGMVDQFLIRLASNTPPYNQFLEYERVVDMALNRFDYPELLEDEQENIKIPAPLNGNFKTLKFIKKFSDYKKEDTGTLHIFFSIEGGHAYYGVENADTDLNTMLDNFRALLTKDAFVFFSGITHLTPNVFANHAYGNKILSRGHFIPKGYGISANGKTLINEIYSKNVLVDIKHMSWVARQKFYELHRENWSGKPIIASHVAFTGFSFTKRNDYIRDDDGVIRCNEFYKIRYHKKTGFYPGTYFNPNSINFYDEDVVTILKSKGLVGIILDIRVLGGGKGLFTSIRKEQELISSREFDDWNIPHEKLNNMLVEANNDDKYIRNELVSDIWDEEDLAAEQEEIADLFPTRATQKASFQQTPHEHLKYFINQLLKFKKIADEHANELADIKPWDHICIGSDFDGMISAIHCCKDTTEFKSFAALVSAELPKAASQFGVKLDLDITDIVKQLFFKNAYDFLQTHFSNGNS